MIAENFVQNHCAVLKILQFLQKGLFSGTLYRGGVTELLGAKSRSFSVRRAHSSMLCGLPSHFGGCRLEIQ